MCVSVADECTEEYLSALLKCALATVNCTISNVQIVDAIYIYIKNEVLLHMTVSQHVDV